MRLMTMARTPFLNCHCAMGEAGLWLSEQCPHDGQSRLGTQSVFLISNVSGYVRQARRVCLNSGTGQCCGRSLQGRSLTPVALTIIYGEVCATGVHLVADEEEDLRTKHRA